MPTLNLGILAHVDAGKTTLTERLLYETGATRHLGRVDHGDTTTDSDSIERRRGITIRTAVATMTLPSPSGPVKVNLIDTPGHADFVAEVERALAVLDGAVLVVSAVEGVQAQTRVLIRILERLGLPFLVFVNKMDRAGASLERTLDALREELARSVVDLSGARLGRGGARRRGAVGRPAAARVRRRAARPTSSRRSRRWPSRPGSAHVHPVLSGAALAGVGIAEVLAAITTYLPTVDDGEAEPLHATVFKIDRDADGHRLAYLRLHEGRLESRDHVTVHRRLPTGDGRDARGAGATRSARSTAAPRPGAGARWPATSRPWSGSARSRSATSSAAGTPRAAAGSSGRPGSSRWCSPATRPTGSPLFQALQQLSEQDPLIDARLAGVDEELTVSIYGEVQKEVLAARLESEYGVAAEFLPTRTVHVERVAGTGEGYAKTAMGNASLGLRVGPAPVGAGLDYALGEGVERGYLLPSFHVAIEETLAREVAEGLHGWRLTDVRVRVTHSRFRRPHRRRASSGG